MKVAGLIADRLNAGSRFGFVEIDFRDNIEGSVAAYRQSLVSNYGGAVGDYELYTPVNGVKDMVNRFPDDFVLQWTGRQISGLDFSSVTNRRTLVITATKKRMRADGTDSLTVTFTLYEPDLITVVNTTENIFFTGVKNGVSVTFMVHLVAGRYTKTYQQIIPEAYTFGNANFVDGKEYLIKEELAIKICEVL